MDFETGEGIRETIPLTPHPSQEATENEHPSPFERKVRAEKYFQEAQYDVLIIGAGLVGLTLGCILAKFGINFHIVEQETGKRQYPGSRAIGVWQQTLDLLQLLDQELRVQFEREGVRPAAIHLKLQDASSDASLSLLPNFNPLLLSQCHQERILTDYLEKLAPNAISYATKAIDNIQYQDAVVTTVERHKENGLRQNDEIISRWLVGCDGAHSTVRKTNGIGFTGTGLPQVIWLLNCKLGELDSNDPGPNAVVVQSAGNKAICIRAPVEAVGGTVAIICPFIKNGMQDEVGVERPQQPTFEQFLAEIKLRSVLNSQYVDPAWITAIRAQFRIADQYRLDRILLAGDSAHCHSPLGGQGANMGIQDAFNLGWKLTARLSEGSSKNWLLDSYESERKPVAQRIVSLVYKRQKLISRLQGWLLRGVLCVVHCIQWIPGLRALAAENFGTSVNQMWIKYPQSYIAFQDWKPPVSLFDKIRGWFRPAAYHNKGAGSRLPNIEVYTGDRQKPRANLYALMDGTQWTILFVDSASGSVTEDSTWTRLNSHFSGTKLLGITIECRRLGSDEAEVVLGDKWIAVDENEAMEKLYGFCSNKSAWVACAYLIRPDGYIAYRQTPIGVDRFVNVVAELSVV